MENERSRRRTAYFPGTCRVCNTWFEKGTDIVYDGSEPRGRKCAHVACVDGGQQDGAPPEPQADWAADVAEMAAEAQAEVKDVQVTPVQKMPELEKAGIWTPAERAIVQAIFETLARGLLELARMGFDPAREAARAAREEADVRHKCYDRLARWIKSGVTRIWITGPAGTGKTHASEQIAKELGIPFYVVTPIESRYDGLGYNDAHGRYVETPIYRWAVDPDPRAVLLLDEVDGFQPGALIALNAVLANGLGVFPHAQIPIASTKIVIGTANTLGDGPDVKYSGRLAQDASVVDRFSAWLEWGVDEAVEAKIAQAKCPVATTAKAVTISQQVRRVLAERKTDLDWGPRRTYAIAQLMAAGEPARDATLAAGLMRLPDRESILASVSFEKPAAKPTKAAELPQAERFRGKPWDAVGANTEERARQEMIKANMEFGRVNRGRY